MLKNIKWIKGTVLGAILLALSMLFIIIPNISAASNFTSALSPSKGSVRTGETFTVAITMSGLDSDGLGSANYTVGFDDNLFTYVSTSGSGVNSNLVGNSVKLAFVDMTGGSSPKHNGTFATLTFTAKSTTSTVSGAFSLSSAGTKSKNGDNITSSNSGTNVQIFIPSTNANLASLSLSSGSLSPAFNSGTISYTATVDSASVSINATAAAGASLTGAGAKNLNYGGNSFNIVVTAEDGTTKKTYTVNINRPDNRSSDSKLRSLTISNHSFSFDPSNVNYSVILSSNVSVFSVTGVANDNKSSVAYSPSQSINLNYGQTSAISVIVTAENGSRTTYKVTATRKDDRSANNDLKELSVSGTSIKFNGGTSYTGTVENGIASVDISAAASDPKSVVSGAGKKSLKVGSNTYRVTVTAENGSEKIYTITIIRKAKDGEELNLSKVNTLKSLVIEGVSLEFDSETLTYNVSVENSVSEIKLHYELSDAKSSAVIEGKTSLEVGSNKINIIVTAENGETKIYSLNVERKNTRTIIDNNDEKIIAEINNENGDPEIFVLVDSSSPNKTVSSEILRELSGSNKILVYEVVNSSRGAIYSVALDGSKLGDFDDSFNFNITFESNYPSILNDLIGGRNHLPINIEYSGKFPAGIIIRVFITDKFTPAGNSLYLYYFNTDTSELELVQENVEIVDGYIELQLDHASEYVLLDEALETAKEPFWNIKTVIIIVGSIAVIGSAVFVIIKKKIKLFPTK